MPLVGDLTTLAGWIKQFPRIGLNTLGGAGAPMIALDFVMIGAIKRSLSLASGLQTMVETKNMVCSRALLRMQLDTVSRVLAYTYVTNPEEMARAVIEGTQLKKFKSRDGKALTDSYLVERLSHEQPWVVTVYKSTSGYVHFSERQLFDSVHSLGNDSDRIMTFQISHIDDKYPEDSWAEVVACFNHLTKILVATLEAYQAEKAVNPTLQRDAPTSLG